MDRPQQTTCPHCLLEQALVVSATDQQTCISCGKDFSPNNTATTPTLPQTQGRPTRRFSLGSRDRSLLGTQLGQVTITGVLGKGGMGLVYIGRHVDLDIDVAVKVLPDDVDEHVIQRFLREARLAIRLNHPNVVRIHNVGQQDGHYYIVMELVEGTDAAHMMEEGGRFPYHRALEIAIAAADALHAAHEEGLVHRDMKPHNILIDVNERTKISDFGLARASASSSGLTMSGQLMGTPHYMSPEQAETLPIDRRSDIYSLGITLYHMLTGAPPFQGDTPIAVALSHVRRDVPFPDDVFRHFPEQLTQVLKKMCARKLDERYASAAEVANELRKLRELVPEDQQADNALLAPLLSESSAMSRRAQDIAQQSERSSSQIRFDSFFGVDRGLSARSPRAQLVSIAGKMMRRALVLVGIVGGALFLIRELDQSSTDFSGSSRSSSNQSESTWAYEPVDKLLNDAESKITAHSSVADLDNALSLLRAAESLGLEGEQRELFQRLHDELHSQRIARAINDNLMRVAQALEETDLYGAHESLLVTRELLEQISSGELRDQLAARASTLETQSKQSVESSLVEAIALAHNQAQEKEFSSAASLLRNIDKRLLDSEQENRLLLAREELSLSISQHFDELNQQALSAINSGEIDEALLLVERAGRLELKQDDRARLADLHTLIPEKRRYFEMMTQLHEARRAILHHNLEHAAFLLTMVENTSDESVRAQRAKVGEMLVEARYFDELVAQHDIPGAQQSLTRLSSLLDEEALDAYANRAADVQRELDRFHRALRDGDISEAQRSISTLRTHGVVVFDLEAQLRSTSVSEPSSDLELIRNGQWYRVEKRFRRFGWNLDVGTPPPGSSQDVYSALLQIGREASHLRTSGRQYYNGVALLPDGESALLLQSDGLIELRSTQGLSGEALRSTTIRNTSVSHIRALHDGASFICATQDGQLLVYDIATFQQRASVDVVTQEHPVKQVSAIALSRDGEVVSVACEDRFIRTFKLPSLEPYGEMIEIESPPNALDVSHTHDRLAVCSDDGRFKLFSLSTNTLVLSGIPSGKAIQSIAFSPDNTLMALVSQRSLYVYNLEDQRLYRELDRISKHDIDTLVFSPDGTTILLISESSREMLIVDYESNSIVRELNGHTKGVFDASYDARGRYLLTSGGDRSAVLWKMYGSPID